MCVERKVLLFPLLLNKVRLKHNGFTQAQLAPEPRGPGAWAWPAGRSGGSSSEGLPRDPVSLTAAGDAAASGLTPVGAGRTRFLAGCWAEASVPRWPVARGHPQFLVSRAFGRRAQDTASGFTRVNKFGQQRPRQKPSSL